MSFSPYSKEYQLRGHQKEKETPDFKPQRHKRKRKQKKNTNVQYFHNRRIPHWKERGEFSRQTKNEIKRIWGEYCFVCGSPNISIHHVYEKGYSKGGRGVKTNGLPLCMLHHTDQNHGIHHDRILYNKVRQMFIEKFGEYYYCDKYDLWMKGLIESPTDELYDRFMEGQVKADGN